MYHNELFPRPADQIRIWDFLSGKPSEKILLSESDDPEMFKFLDSTDDDPYPLIDNSSKPHQLKSDKRRIYSLNYNHANVNNNNNNNNKYYTFFSLIIGLTMIFYYFR